MKKGFSTVLIIVLICIIGVVVLTTVGYLYSRNRAQGAPTNVTRSGSQGLKSCSLDLNVKQLFGNDSSIQVSSGPNSSPSARYFWRASKEQAHVPFSVSNDVSWGLAFPGLNLDQIKDLESKTLGKTLTNQEFVLDQLNTNDKFAMTEGFLNAYKMGDTVYIFQAIDYSGSGEFQGYLECFSLANAKIDPIFTELSTPLATFFDNAANMQYDEILKRTPHYIELSFRPYPGGAGAIVAFEYSNGQWKKLWGGQDDPPCELFTTVRNEVLGRRCYDQSIKDYSTVK